MNIVRCSMTAVWIQVIRSAGTIWLKPVCRQLKLERKIAALCIRIGLILFYSFLQLMNPKSNDLISAMEYKSNTTSSREISEYLAMEWLKNSVDFEKILISLRQEFYLLECKFKINSNKKSHTRHSFFLSLKIKLYQDCTSVCKCIS